MDNDIPLALRSEAAILEVAFNDDHLILAFGDRAVQLDEEKANELLLATSWWLALMKQKNEGRTPSGDMDFCIPGEKYDG